MVNRQAKMIGNTFVIEKQTKSKYDRCWLYNFVQETEKRNVSEMLTDQVHHNTLITKV